MDGPLDQAVPLQLPIPRQAAPRRTPGGRFDLAGAVTATGAMLLLVHGVVRLGEAAAHPADPAVVLAAGLVLLTAFALIERRSPAPLIRPRLLRTGTLLRANLGALLFAGSFFGFQLVVTSTCRTCAAGPRCRPASPCWPSASTPCSHRPSPRNSSTASATPR
ncbi:hypothetical protein [Kitasatospora griseola]|uniref:hypothetical protein n=1 Tax=Kitasatospora griseola TaxID=2064 RepID=UPI003822764D